MQQQNYADYLKELLPTNKLWVSQLEEEAENERIPIMDWQGIQLLQQIIRLHNPTSILEIGTAIGYSALKMNEASHTAKIITVERNEEMYNRAQLHIKKLKKEDHIDLLLGDAFNLREEIIERGPYDLIFIDAAKGQYKRFFESFETTLTANGCIVTDNVLFRGYAADPKLAPKRLQPLAEKINDYNKWLASHPDYYTSFFSTGDGIAVSIKR